MSTDQRIKKALDIAMVVIFVESLILFGLAIARVSI